MKNNIFGKRHIRLALASENREEAIRRAGRFLEELGCVSTEYIDSMLERERSISTYMGKGLAIPHGVGEARKFINQSGVVFLQYPNGVEFEGGLAHLILGLAVSDGEHLELLSGIANLFMNISDDELEVLFTTQDVDYIYRTLAGIDAGRS